MTDRRTDEVHTCTLVTRPIVQQCVLSILRYVCDGGGSGGFGGGVGGGGGSGDGDGGCGGGSGCISGGRVIS